MQLEYIDRFLITSSYTTDAEKESLLYLFLKIENRTFFFNIYRIVILTVFFLLSKIKSKSLNTGRVNSSG